MNKLATDKNRRSHVSLRGGAADKEQIEDPRKLVSLIARQNLARTNTETTLLSRHEPLRRPLEKKRRSDGDDPFRHRDQNGTAFGKNQTVPTTKRQTAELRSRSEHRQVEYVQIQDRLSDFIVVFITFFQPRVRQVTARTVLNTLVASMMTPAEITE